MRYFILAFVLFVFADAQANAKIEKYTLHVGMYSFWAEYECPTSFLEGAAKGIDKCVGKTTFEIFNTALIAEYKNGSRSELDKVLQECFEKNITAIALIDNCSATFHFTKYSKGGFEEGDCPGPDDVTRAYCKKIKGNFEYDHDNRP